MMGHHTDNLLSDSLNKKLFILVLPFFHTFEIVSEKLFLAIKK
jgi:hypothetical protein